MSNLVESIARKTATFTSKHSAGIVSGIAAAGVIATAIMAVKATPKALKLIEDKKKVSDKDDLTVKETVKTAWKCYIPAAVIGVSTIACIFAANTLNKRQQALLTSAYVVVSNSYEEYKGKVKKIYGEEAHQRIMRELAVEKAQKVPIEAGSCFCNHTLGFDDLDDEERLFYDAMGERYFTSTVTRVLEAEYHLNRNFTLGWIPSLNDFYDFLGLDNTDFGDTVGWTNSSGSYYWIDFEHMKTEIDGGLECWIIESDVPPTPEFLEDR